MSVIVCWHKDIECNNPLCRDGCAYEKGLQKPHPTTPSPDDLVEEVARAIFEIVKKFDDNPIWEGDEFTSDEIYRRHSLEIARTAIAAYEASRAKGRK